MTARPELARAIGGTARPEDTAAAVQALLGTAAPTPADYVRAARGLAELRPRLRPLRVSVVSSFTAELLRPYLAVESARRGIAVEPYFGPYGRLEEELLDPGSGAYRSEPEVIVVADLAAAAPHLAEAGATGAELDATVAAIGARTERLVGAVRSRSSAAVVLFNFPTRIPVAAPLSMQIGVAPGAELTRRANAELARVSQLTAGVSVLDLDRVVVEHGAAVIWDDKLAHMARMPLGTRGQIAVAARLARTFRALVSAPCKALALDLDGVLWGGVLGDDGIDGIALGEDFPGNVYKSFQRYLLSLRAQGVLLAIASKNDREHVERAFATHGDMLLRLDSFSSVQVHWSDKASSLREIARDLNIGLDAVAFFDDSPFERELVRSQVPDVHVIEVPADSSEFISAIERSELFDRLVVSGEDRRRAEMMDEERKRSEILSANGSIDDFLRSLGIRVRVGNVGTDTIGRVAQLLAKTNQFNLTGRRLSAAEIDGAVRHGAVALWARVSDAIGDSGLTAAALARPADGGRWTVDALVMSCRVLGRGIETAVLAALLDDIRARGGRTLVGEYVATDRNAQVADLYPRHGFAPVDGRPATWAREASERIAMPDHITLERE